MSDVMLFGVLRMPYELAMSSELMRRQFYDRAQQAADMLERREQHRVANPLGGLASMFRTIADRIENGEPYDEVLQDYGLQHNAK